MKKTLLTTAALIAAMAITGYFEGPAHALGAITPRPDCEIIPSDPADINKPITYGSCSGASSGGNGAATNFIHTKPPVPVRDEDPPDECDKDDCGPPPPPPDEEETPDSTSW
jgi:hypothetical protein